MEVRVRYERVSELIRCLNKYHKALGKMKKSITAIREVYKEGKGKTMESLVNESDILIKYIDGLEQDVSDLSTILVKYVTETTAIIKPEQRDRVMKIDRNNILQKKNSIINTCSKIPKIHSDVTVQHFDDWLLWGEDEDERELELARRARNDDKLDSIKYHIRSVEKEITSLIDKVNGVYNGVKNYEDKDRQFAWEAKKLVKNKESLVEKHDDSKGKIGEKVIHFGEGLLDSIVDLVKGLADSTVGIIKYDASFVTYLYGELSGNEIPKWADEYCYNTSVETNEKIKAVLNDPMIVVDGIKNGIQDTYEEKGVAYCCGYAVGFIGTTVAGTKGMDKLAKLGKGGKAARTLEELGYVDDAVVTVGDDLAKLAGEVKTVTKVADTAEDLTKVAGKVKKVTKADELSEASKALAEGGEAAGKGGLVEEVVSKNGNYSSLRDLMSPEEGARYDGYWNEVGYNKAITERNMLIQNTVDANKKAVAIGAYDIETGNVTAKFAGAIPDTINNQLIERANLIGGIGSKGINGKNTVGVCAEFQAANELLNSGGNLTNIRFTEAVRPRTGKVIPTCSNCLEMYYESFK